MMIFYTDSETNHLTIVLLYIEINKAYLLKTDPMLLKTMARIFINQQSLFNCF